MGSQPKFYVGQAVVCLKGDGWLPPPGAPTPKKNAVYTVCRILYGKPHGTKWWQFWTKKICGIGLRELGGWAYNSEFFAPVELLPDAALAELLAEVDTLAPYPHERRI